MREILNTGEDERTGVAYGARAGTRTGVAAGTGAGTEEHVAEAVMQPSLIHVPISLL